MKKRILMLLCTTVLALSITAPPALAAGGPFYPISVEEYTYGSFDELRINKVYQLSLSDDPSGIPTEDFERNGWRYFLLDMIREDTVKANYTGQVAKTGCEVVTYTAIFGSEELFKEEKTADPSNPPDQTDLETTDADPAPADTGGVNWLSLLGCAGGVAALAAAVLWTIQKMKGRRT